MNFESAYNAVAQGEALLDIGRYAQAAERFRAAIASAPDWAKPRCDLVSALMGLGDLDQALEAAQSAIACDPAEAWTHLRRAEVLIRMERGPEAVQAAMESVRNDPEDGSAHWVLAAARLTAGDLDGAADAAWTSVQLNPLDPFPWRTLARISMREQRFGEAEDRWRKALELDPTDALSVNLLGDTLKAMGDHDAARALYEQAARMDPASDVLRNDLVQANREFVNGWPEVLVAFLILTAVISLVLGGTVGNAVGAAALGGLVPAGLGLFLKRRKRIALLTPASQMLLRDQPLSERNDFVTYLWVTIPIVGLLGVVLIMLHIQRVGVHAAGVESLAGAGACFGVVILWLAREQR